MDPTTRRAALKVGAAAALAAGLTAVSAGSSPAARLPLTPACTDGDDTPGNIEGPYFKRNSPLRSDLRTAGVTGVLLTLRGTVHSEHCLPVPGALLEFWQADDKGVYDNTGFTLRGHQYTPADGTYSLETIVPKDYVDAGTHRTPHIHVKVQPANGRVLTSQLFFPDTTTAYGLDFAQLNARDRFLNRKCTLALGVLSDNHYAANFDFVVAA
ncbi:hypothetical protein GCM10010174_18540 [Kutzneria viridogrisea]|uniref:Intradiol ring-cleavage dioxygenases domain-containing protein n=2 Tax=Kutzneria TaxID=43356 RepID=W5WFN9_9PSEU|nr:hypothetical protein [Kutzneria albida]AHH99570.1 hypothetical protein KALB_6210 [Kutzneria albida DSM 43870]MBA8922875.1 protocatechuate 3,4-dioxygenase beta subunit [Kutzneria viridogrisea]